MKRIGKYMAKYWYMYLAAIVFLLLGILFDVAVPQVIQHIIDDVLIGGNHSILIWFLIALFILGAGRGIFKYLQEFTGDCIGVKISRDIRRTLFKHIEHMPMSFFAKNNTGELMARIKEDVERIWDAVGFVGLLCAEAIIHTIVVIVCMLRISPILSLIPLCIMPIVGYIAIRLEKSLDKVYDDISEENAVLNTVAQENITGVRTVKAFSRESYEIQKFKKHNRRYYELNMNQARVMAKYNPNISFLTRVLLLLSVCAGGLLVVLSKISLGQLTAFIEYANNIVWPMEILGWVTNAMAAAVASNKKINKILDEVPDIQSPKEPETPEHINGHLTFSHVGYQSGSQDILSDISFDIPAGKTLGIMGMTGSGKSTLVNLTERFSDVTSGVIEIDGIDIRNMDLQQLRNSLAVVMQDVFLFSDTVNENIRIGNRDHLDADAIQNASAMASADEFVSKLPEGYDTVIGERGVGLSGGQKQRLSIARALAKDASILILDDATSALDMETEHELQQKLKDVNCTKVIIAHRISAVRHADEIIILQDGKIAERGTHESLMQKRGLYYQTYSVQYEAPENNTFSDLSTVQAAQNSPTKTLTETEVSSCQ